MKSVRLRSLLPAILAVAALLLAACSSGSSGSGDTYSFSGAQRFGTLIPVADRKPVPQFGGSLLTHGTYNLAAYKGKAIVVNFWGTWCGPCTVETPTFQKVYDAYKNKDVSFVGIDIKDGTRDAPRSFVRDNHITYPIVYDETGETALRMGNIRVQATPFTVLLDKQHRVAGVYVGPLTAKDLEPMLNKLVAGT
jgi:thiol-disulfide isomerase/thioredoxin